LPGKYESEAPSAGKSLFVIGAGQREPKRGPKEQVRDQKVLRGVLGKKKKASHAPRHNELPKLSIIYLKVGGGRSREKNVGNKI